MARIDFAKLPKFSELPVKKDAPPDSCWGVFGDEDVLGCLNFLTPEALSRRPAWSSRAKSSVSTRG